MTVKVSCVMPACYSDRYVGLAIQCFFNQTHENRELVVLDNNRPGESIEHVVPDDRRITYVRCEPMTIGTLRNLGASHATGDVVVNWDCDDWSHPDRVAFQVGRLQSSGKAVTGFHNILFYNTADAGTYKYSFSRGRVHPPYACGTSQCYTREWWSGHQYRDTSKGEDYYFQREAQYANQLDSCDAEHLCIARAHPDSTCPPQFGHSQFPSVPRGTFPEMFFSDCATSAHSAPTG
jgi:glycosyltransferase involved in cell wall biosynthesis